MNWIKYIIVAFLVGSVLMSCEEEFIPEVSTDPEQIVVEGYIQSGDIDVPPFVLLTRSIPFFSTLSADDLSDIFIHDAIISVSDGVTRVELQEFCWDDLDSTSQDIANAIVANLGLSLTSIPFNFCVYFDPTFSLQGEIGGSYSLDIEVEGKSLNAMTTIPDAVPIDSFEWVVPAGEIAGDSLLELRGFITDPAMEENYYRYFTSVNVGPFIPGFNSVIDDQLFNGQAFEFPIPKAEPRDFDFTDESFGLFKKGDQVIVRWSNMDATHFRFWSTLEASWQSQGPFTSYVRVEGNVSDAIGIWGGYTNSFYVLQVPE